MENQYKMSEEQFMKLVRVTTALALQELYEKEVIDNITCELSDLILDILRLHNEEKRVIL